MNPFQLTGFGFLGIYLLFGIAVFCGLRQWLRHAETANVRPQQNMTDPYLIAFLRAGENEALRVATVALLDRALLTSDGQNLKTTNTKAFGAAQRPIEKAILQHYAKSSESHTIFKEGQARVACNAYAKSLKEQHLLADRSVYAGRLMPVTLALGLLVAATATKISIAFSQGRHNVGFLIVLTIAFAIAGLWAGLRRRTAAGDAMLADLKSLFSRLKGRAKTLRAGGQTNEAALLAAVFGLAALPAASFPFMSKLYPAKSGSGSGCSSSSCGSSSSCSSGSSCGGGCGGGGCGG